MIAQELEDHREDYADHSGGVLDNYINHVREDGFFGGYLDI